MSAQALPVAARAEGGAGGGGGTLIVEEAPGSSGDEAGGGAGGTGNTGCPNDPRSGGEDTGSWPDPTDADLPEAEAEAAASLPRCAGPGLEPGRLFDGGCDSPVSLPEPLLPTEPALSRPLFLSLNF